MRRFVRAGLSLALLLPMHAAHGIAATKRWIAEVFVGAIAKAVTLGSLVLAAALAAASDHLVVESIVLLILLLVGGAWTASVLERPVGLLLLGRRQFPREGIAPARESLRHLGLDDVTVARILAEVDAGREVHLAEFDQQNRLLSDVGPIPYFASELITREEFIPRKRHRLDLVAAFGVVAIRKAYQGQISLQNEALALAALARLDGVPRIVHLVPRTRVMYQSFLPGENLGSLMAAKGASVEVQHQVATGRPPVGSWTEGSLKSEARRTALRVMSEVVPPGCVDELGGMLLRIHASGVTIGDVKYGNVLLHEGHPVLCDFDWSRVIDRTSIAALVRRDEERDIFNYSFGAGLPTMAGARRELSAIVAARPEFGEAGIDFGGGIRFGRRWTLAAGSGRWRAIRGRLPEFRDRRILDLGSRDAIVLLEMLRAGASRVTTHQPDAVSARFARACHGLVELVDNRSYDFVVIEGPGSLDDGRGHDLATMFASFDGLPADELELQLARVPTAVRRLLLHGVEHDDTTSPARLCELLSRHGFRLERSEASRISGHPITLATRT